MNAKKVPAVAGAGQPGGPGAGASDALEAQKPAKRVRGRLGWTVAIVFAFLFAVDVFEGLSNLVGVVQSLSDLGIPLPAGALLTLIGQVALPVIVFVAILWGTRRSSAFSSALVFLVGLALMATFTLSLQSEFRAILPF